MGLGTQAIRYNSIGIQGINSEIVAGESVVAQYEIGYGKPPKSHQWRPGESGNPQGRPRGSRNKPTLAYFLHAEAAKLLYRTEKKLYDEAGLSQYGIKPKRRIRTSAPKRS